MNLGTDNDSLTSRVMAEMPRSSIGSPWEIKAIGLRYGLACQCAVSLSTM